MQKAFYAGEDQLKAFLLAKNAKYTYNKWYVIKKIVIRKNQIRNYQGGKRMGLLYQESVKVRHYHCNALGEMTLPAILDIMLIASNNQEATIPEAKEGFRKEGWAWIITQNQININRLPRYNEDIIAETEATTYNKFFSKRYYALKTTDGIILAEAETTFALIDLNQRSIVRIPEIVAEWYQVEKEDKASRRKRLSKKVTTESKVDQFEVKFLDIDLNNHVNNTIYLRWVTNSLGMEWFEKYIPTSFTIAYEKEMYLHQEGAVHSDLSALTDNLKIGESFNTQHVIDSEENAHCLAEITWQVR